MPARTPTKKAAKTARSTSARHGTTAKTPDEISYETKLTIVILLLLFVYPLGLVFMWAWMRNWPTWLKVLISLPIILGIIGTLIGIFFLSLLIRRVATDKNLQNMLRQKYQDQYRQEYQLTPSPATSITPVISLPSSGTNSQTY